MAWIVSGAISTVMVLSSDAMFPPWVSPNGYDPLLSHFQCDMSANYITATLVLMRGFEPRLLA